VLEAATAAQANAESRGLALYPYQAVGVSWLKDRTGALLADEMGCGKTVQALAALPENAMCVVIAPAAVKGVWMAEARRWRPDLHVSILSGRGSFRWPRSPKQELIEVEEIVGWNCGPEEQDREEPA